MKSGNLNFLEPSGPLQACKGAALPFYSWYCTLLYVRCMVLHRVILRCEVRLSSKYRTLCSNIKSTSKSIGSSCILRKLYEKP